ncbi:acyl-CoA dehydrogenase [Herbiconiux sp. A18JL235]|uniref:Acyl-CoA dehydrogenase n=1 Tax=Herbiconiux sp. A18JL235 TaxID=3152363 RepID=A0AB39BI51_9MICO
MRSKSAPIGNGGVLIEPFSSRAEVELLDGLFARAAEASGDRAREMSLAQEIGTGAGDRSAGLSFGVLATLAAVDVTLARVVEPHLDAVGILAECPERVDLDSIGAGGSSTWGVFAAETSGLRLDAREAADGGWVLTGTKPWCSLADELSHALVTAHTAAGRRLFAVALQQPGVISHPELWAARGLPAVPSGPVDFTEVPAVVVGAAGWYLDRPGFERGGVGVAACWFGGALGLVRRARAAVRLRPDDDIAAMHLGRMGAALLAARSVLADAARSFDEDEREDSDEGRRGGGGDDSHDDGPAAGAAPAPRSEAALLAQLTRSVVRRECELVLRECAHLLGPAPYATEPEVAARAADLGLYLQQDHAERDEARAGRMLATAEEARR